MKPEVSKEPDLTLEQRCFAHAVSKKGGFDREENLWDQIEGDYIEGW